MEKEGKGNEPHCPYKGAQLALLLAVLLDLVVLVVLTVEVETWVVVVVLPPASL